MRNAGADIAIVGAGIAGLSAALALVERHASAEHRPAILILEAAATLGGRAKTVLADNGCPVDLGAHWLHGGKANPFFQWLRDRYGPRLGFIDDLVHPHLHIASDTMPASYREDGVGRLRAAYDAFKAAAPETDPSLADLAARIGDPQVTEVTRYIARNWMAIEDPALVSADEFFEDPFGPGGMQIVGGLSRVVELMAEELRASGVAFVMGCRVVAIEQDPDAGCLLIGEAGTRHRAKAAIVTVSAGVLQQDGIRFAPPLPADIRRHIGDLGMAELAKLIIPVQASFFEARGIQADTHISLYATDPPIFCHAHTAGTATITLFGGGDFARLIESLSPAAAAGLAAETFKQIPLLAGAMDQRDGEIIVTSWNNDPLYRGSYTAIRPGARRSGPLQAGRVILAGEAFVADQRQGPSMLVGAWYSGFEAAEMLSKAAF